MYTEMIDIDKNGMIDTYDLQTCLGNIQNEKFFQKNGEVLRNHVGYPKFFPTEKLTREKASEVCKQIRA